VSVFQTPKLPRQAHANAQRTTTMLKVIIFAISATLVKTESLKELSLTNNAFVTILEDIMMMLVEDVQSDHAPSQVDSTQKNVGSQDQDVLKVQILKERANVAMLANGILLEQVLAHVITQLLIGGRLIRQSTTKKEL